MPCAGCGAATPSGAVYCGSCGMPVGRQPTGPEGYNAEGYRAEGSAAEGSGTRTAGRPQPRPAHLPPGSSPASLGSKARRDVERSARLIVSAVRRRPARAALIGAVALGVVVVLALVIGMVTSGGSSSGLAGSYTCSLPDGSSATITFTDTGSTAGEPQGSGEYAPLAGEVTGPQGVIETFSHGTFERGHVDFGLVDNSDDPAGLGDGATLENGTLSLDGGQITCS